MERLSVSSITLSPDIQPRTSMDTVAIQEYANEMKSGTEFPPIEVVFDGQVYWVWDGFHRGKAAQLAGLSSIAANVQSGTKQDAQWLALSANRAHGLRRTNEDKRRTIELALEHPKAASKSLRDIANHCGISYQTVANYKNSIYQNLTDTITVIRNGSTYTMNTANIGKQNGHDSIMDLQKQLPSTDNENCFYQDDLTRIWQGDASNLWFIEDNTIDLIVTSPPYNIGAKNGNGRILWRGVEYSTIDDKIPEQDYQDLQVLTLDELWRVTRPGGSLFYNHKVRNRNGQGIHPMAWIARSKWNFRQQITWDRGSTHNKEMSYFWPHDELIFWLTKGTEDVYLSPEGARMSTVWRFNFETNNDHPAPFPKILPAMCIRAASKEGDLVLDPFGGSMTTCRAARELKRRSIGVEISKEYVIKYSYQFHQGILL